MLFYDFHIHSALSPCGDDDMTPNNIVNMAAISGLDVIAVSDHNSIGNASSVIKAGKKCGIKVIPGMEVETEEEVHILTLYPDIKSAKYVADFVYDKLPDIENRPEIFGNQYLMDEDDNILGTEKKLLLSPTAISLNKLFDIVTDAGGLFIPAHVDRHSYSILTNLGFIPDDLNIKYIEISKNTSELNSFLENRTELSKYFIFRNSDAHYLENIAVKEFFLNISDISEIFTGKL